MIDEREIIDGLKSGNEDSFKFLYDNHYEMLCKVSYYFMKDRFLAESVVNDLFFHLWEIRHKIVLTPPIKNYLVTAVKNRSINQLAQKHRNKEVVFSKFDSDETSIYDWLESPEEPLARYFEQETQTVISRAIESLPPMCKQVFMLSRFNHMSYEDIAQQLDISVNTVKYHIKSALERLRKELKLFL